MKKIFSLLVLLIMINNSYSQTSANLAKYWFYRDRLNKYFVVPGKKIGESQVVGEINLIYGETDFKNVDFLN